MAKLMMVMGLAILLSTQLAISCRTRVPVEMVLNKQIEITESQVEEIAENIFNVLTTISFEHPAGSPPGMIDHTICSAAFKIWLRKLFDEDGRVPTGTVFASEYAASSNDPLIHQCRPINFGKEFEKASEDTAKKSEQEGQLFDLSEFRDIISSNNCTNNFIDPEQAKIEINEIYLRILENTLSISAPTYTLYTSYEELNKDDLKEDNAEKDLSQDGTLLFLGKTKIIKPGIKGDLPLDLESDRQKFKDAESPLVSLDGSLLAVPAVLAVDPEETVVAGRNYYVVPKGKIRLTIGLKVSISVSLADAKCAFDRFKEAIKEEDKERKERFEKPQK